MKTIPQGLLTEITHRLVAEFDPEVIYLFGSHAWGEPNEDSDLDLLVIIAESDEPSPARRAARAHRAMRGIMAPIDILVWTRAEAERYRPVKASLSALIFDKGKVLYESAFGSRVAHQS
jgi:predicted nucleotidyltransferase